MEFPETEDMTEDILVAFLDRVDEVAAMAAKVRAEKGLEKPAEEGMEGGEGVEVEMELPEGKPSVEVEVEPSEEGSEMEGEEDPLDAIFAKAKK
jgi:hypothetical protein